MYEPDTLTSFQRSLDRHLTQELRKPYSIIRDTPRFSSSREKLKAARKMLKNKGKEIRTMLLNHWKWMTLTRCGPADLWGTPVQRYYSILFGFYSRCIWGCVEEMNIINLHIVIFVSTLHQMVSSMLNLMKEIPRHVQVKQMQVANSNPKLEHPQQYLSVSLTYF